MQSRADTARAAVWLLVLFALIAVVLISFGLGSPLPVVSTLLVVGGLLAWRRKRRRRPVDLS